VEAQDHEVIRLLGLAQSIPVEQIEVLRRTHDEFLDLPLRYVGASTLRDHFNHLVERRLRALLGDHPPKLVRVLLFGQLHRGIEWRESLGAGGSVQVPIKLDLTELRLDLSGSAPSLRSLDAVGTSHIDGTLLGRALIEVRLHHRAQHLAALCPKQPLDLVQRRVHRLGAGEVVLKLLHVLPRLAERTVIGDRCREVGAGHQVQYATRSRSIRMEPSTNSAKTDRISVAAKDPHPSAFGPRSPRARRSRMSSGARGSMVYLRGRYRR